MQQEHPFRMPLPSLLTCFRRHLESSPKMNASLTSEEGEEGIGCDKLAVELLVRHCPEGEDALDDGKDSPRAAGDADEQYSEDSRADLVDVKIMEAY